MSCSVELPTSYIAHNCSILRGEGSASAPWLVAVRASNFKLPGKGEGIDVPGGPIYLDSQTWLVALDEELRMREQQLLIDAPYRDPQGPAKNGLADARVFAWRQEIWALWCAERFPANEWTSVENIMALGVLRDNRIDELRFLPSPHRRLREKNWMPWVIDDELLLVYDIARVEVYRFARGELEPVHRANKPDARLKNCSGSSQLLPWGEDWICVVHTRVVSAARCFYLHRFVVISAAFQIQAVSREFFLESRGIEFCAGLAFSEHHAVLSYGARDLEARLLKIDREKVKELFPN